MPTVDTSETEPLPPEKSDDHRPDQLLSFQEPGKEKNAEHVPVVSVSAETTERQHLGERCIQRLHDLALSSLAASYENDEHSSKHHVNAITLRQTIATTVASENHAPTVTEALLAEATDIFLTRILSLLEHNTPPPGLEDINRNDVDDLMYQYWFDLNDSLLFDISADRLMQLAERVSRHRHTDFLHNTFVEQSLIVFGHATKDERARYDTYLDSLTVPQVLDTLHLFDGFQKILADEETFADLGYQPFRAAIQRVMQAHSSMIVRLRAQRLERSFLFEERLEKLEGMPQPQYPRGKGQLHRIEEVFPDLFPDQNAPVNAPRTESQSAFLQQLRAMGLRQRGEDIDLCASDAASIIDRDSLPHTIAWLDRAGRIQTSSYDQLVENTDINPFAGQADSEFALLLRHMHEPALRRDIENSLGIHLTDIPLRSQIHLLRFLADQDVTGYNRLRDTLHALSDAAPQIAQSFLAFAERPELGDTILHTAELLKESPKEAKALFGAYTTFAENVDWEVSHILGIGNARLGGQMPDRTTMLRHVLRRANHLFVNAEQQMADCPDTQRAEVVQKLVQHFDREATALRRQVADYGAVADQLDHARDEQQAERYRSRLTTVFRELVLGEQEYQLPEQFFTDVEQAAAELRPEQLPTEQPLYFPVGVSRDLPAWQHVWEGKAEAAKPIDVYAWLFWMQNQGQPVELVVCDEVQTTNFQTLYPDLLGEHPKIAAQSFARRIGEAERKQYQQIIDTFGLTNIHLVRYDEFRDRHSETLERYRTLCTKLADMPMWQEAFLATMKGSQQNSATKAERRALLPYAIEEVALVLATRGTKIGHENEAAYDAIAAVLWNVEDYATQHQIALEDMTNNEKLTPVINTVLDALQDRCNTGKSRTTRDQPHYVYLEQFRQNLHRILKTAGVTNVTGISARLVTFPFACPETGSQSFGWRGKGNTGEEVVVRFKEPYSTYFKEGTTALTLESDQIVALPNGDIAGKILALPQEQQRQYANRVLKPLLAHFYKVLDQAPNMYGYRLGRPTMKPAEIKAEFESATSLYELIEKIQEYIIVPASREHPTSIIL